MSKRAIVLIVFAVVLGILCVGMNMDWWRKGEIKILPQIRPPTRNARVAVGDTPVYPVMFAFDRLYRFTEIRVVSADDEKTNKYPHELWHLIADSNSTPSKVVVYGATLRGMKPKVPKSQPEPLEPDVPYVLHVKAGNAEGKVGFGTKELVRATAQ